MMNKQQTISTIESKADTFRDIALAIGNRPELGHEEYYASGLLCELLEREGFRVERGILGLDTAFLATYDTGKPGPVVAFLCEYDALEGLGHACGHHMIGTMSAAAAIGLKSSADSHGGSIRVYGTPAEETKGAKVPMAEAGLFDDCDVALMAHPYHSFERSGESLAMDALRFEYTGVASHAAASPHAGVNALDAVLLLFGGVNALRQQTKSDARIHGIIDHGGKAPNIIPDYASAKFYVRSATRAYTDILTAKVRNCAEAAALATGCGLTISNYEYSYDELRTNEALSEAFMSNLVEAGVSPDEIQSGKDHGSLDLGNVSVRCPAIHPYVKIVEEPYMLHTESFRDSAMTAKALDRMLFGAKMLAATGYDVMTRPELQAAIKEEFLRQAAGGNGENG
ncbi:M20 family metallopeptidase [Paenibacillus soyae]|uniref:Peptidase M20 domain-containing protein 2 n=1 Tax=Paenibacillus soyae TaxID=2969249 RepID=A0A9X2S8G0_9BACL|nr:M20 family metallopeptidase [Paenibacillus soyae]MCR2804304.1 M20 family metallopeptidase [Paenibacillus soyae]